MTGDIINGMFELIGGVLNWANVLSLRKDKSVSGVFWPAWAFFGAWGLWNLYYYPSLGQSASFYGGLFIVSANLTWVVLALKYKKQGILKHAKEDSVGCWIARRL